MEICLIGLPPGFQLQYYFYPPLDVTVSAESEAQKP